MSQRMSGASAAQMRRQCQERMFAVRWLPRELCDALMDRVPYAAVRDCRRVSRAWEQCARESLRRRHGRLYARDTDALRALDCNSVMLPLRNRRVPCRIWTRLVAALPYGGWAALSDDEPDAPFLMLHRSDGALGRRMPLACLALPSTRRVLRAGPLHAMHAYEHDRRCTLLMARLATDSITVFYGDLAARLDHRILPCTMPFAACEPIVHGSFIRHERWTLCCATRDGAWMLHVDWTQDAVQCVPLRALDSFAVYGVCATRDCLLVVARRDQCCVLALSFDTGALLQRVEFCCAWCEPLRLLRVREPYTPDFALYLLHVSNASARLWRLLLCATDASLVLHESRALRTVMHFPYAQPRQCDAHLLDDGHLLLHADQHTDLFVPLQSRTAHNHAPQQ